MIEIPESVETWEETEKTIGETLPVDLRGRRGDPWWDSPME